MPEGAHVTAYRIAVVDRTGRRARERPAPTWLVDVEAIVAPAGR
jgi:hypothetical protein